MVVESTWDAIEAGEWRSKLVPRHVIGSLLGWRARGLRVMLAGTRDRTATLAVRQMFLHVQRVH